MSSLVQGSHEWHDLRRTKIGASDAPSIEGVSPYTTPYKLWQEKLGLVPSRPPNKGTERGQTLEVLARREMEKMVGVSFVPDVRFHASISYMMASLDCVDPSGKHIGEIKCLDEEDHLLACNGQIPKQYVPQLQHQMEVCELERNYYFSFRPKPVFDKDGVTIIDWLVEKESMALVVVTRDDAYIKNMLKKQKIFWECVENLTPPELTNKDYLERQDTEWAMAAGEFNTVNTQMKQLEKRYDTARERLIALANNQSSLGYGVRVSKIKRAGNVDYKAIPELKTINLESYRKKPSESWTIVAI